METWQSRLEASSVDTEHKSFVHDVAYDFYGHRMATCSADKEVRVFERRVVDDATATHAAVLSVDDAVGEEEEEPQVEWRLTSAFGSGEHQAPVHRISWAHPEFGSIIACASQSTVLVWHETDGMRQESSATPTGASGVPPPAQGTPWQCVAKLADSSLYVNDVQFAPSHHGLKLATASADGTIRVYSAPDVLSLRSWHLTTTISAAAMLADAGSVLSISWCTSRFDPPMLAAGLARLSSRGGGHGAGAAASSAAAAAAAAATASGAAVHAVAWAPHCGRSFHAVATASTDGRLRIFHIVAPSADGALDGAVGGEGASKEGGAAFDGPVASAFGADAASSGGGGAALFAVFIFDEATQRYVPGCVLGGGGGSGGGASHGGAFGASAAAPTNALQAPLLRAHCVTNEAAEGIAALAWNVLGTTLASSADDGVVRLWSQSDVTFEDDVTAATTWTCSTEIHAHE